MKHFFIGLIKLYHLIKPLWHSVMMSLFGMAPTCTYQESCSHYTIRMIKKHGTISGLFRGGQRVMRCWRL